MVIMSLRSMLQKLGTNRSTYSNIRSAVLRASQSAAVNNNSRNPEAPSLPCSGQVYETLNSQLGCLVITLASLAYAIKITMCFM